MKKSVSSTNKFWVTLLAAGTLWAGLGLGASFAETDAKDYPATFCRPNYSPYFGVSAGTDAYGLTIYNKSTTGTLMVYCPIIRDLRSRNAKLEWVKVRYFNPYFKSRKVSCRLNRVAPSGKLSATSGDIRGTTLTPGGEIYFRVPRAHHELIFMVACKLPRSGGVNKNQKVRLTGYSVKEKD